MDVAEEGRRLCSKLSRLDFKLYTSHFGSCTTSVSKVTGFSLGSYFVEQRTSLPVNMWLRSFEQVAAERSICGLPYDSKCRI